MNLEVGVDSNRQVCVGVRDVVLERNIFCAKPNPEPYDQSGSQVRKVIGYQSPWSTLE